MELVSRRPDISYKWIVAALLAGVLMAAGCSGLIPATEEPDEPDEPSEEVEEAVPTTRTVEGYRIQIRSTPEKREAEDGLADAVSWWEDVPPSERPEHLNSDDLPVDIKYQQPYYRVRLGNFATRQEAEQALGLVKNRFADAFVVPDTVTITR